ncbi:MAG: helix-turn-helix transcriptional regulator [Deltaproteobacteria bacterium]|nr:helix-turn-helix transcriptional regulator [Deltaproteobacteria bacterium]
MHNLRDRLAWSLTIIKEDAELDKGIKDVDLAKKLGISENTLATYRKGGGDLKGVVIEKLIEHYNFSPDWLFKGVGEPFPGAHHKYDNVCGPDAEQIEPDSENYSFIPKYKAKLSGGPGSFETSTSVENYCAFRTRWLKRRWDVKHLALFEVTGDSMAPLIQQHDMVLIDRSVTNLNDIIEGKIYAFTDDRTVKIKRLVWRGTELWAISDNKIEAPDSRIELETDTFNLIGKVVWIGHEVR